MNYLSLHMLLLTTAIVFSVEANKHKKAKDDFMLDSPIIRLIDGAINVKDLVNPAVQLKKLQSGDKAGGSIIFKGEKRTVKELVDLEAQISKDDSDLAEAIKQAHELILVATKDYEASFSAPEYKSGLKKIIDAWSKQRNRPHTMLLKTTDLSPAEFAEAHLTSFKLIDKFIDELTLLLMDVKRSCKHSNAAFEKALEEMKKKPKKH